MYKRQLRKGAMYQRLGELGIKKMAYAHNKDEFIETALMSLIYEGRFYAFPPVTELPEAGVTVIRPCLLYTSQKLLSQFRLTSTMLSVRLQKMQVRSQDLM